MKSLKTTILKSFGGPMERTNCRTDRKNKVPNIGSRSKVLDGKKK